MRDGRAIEANSTFRRGGRVFVDLEADRAKGSGVVAEYTGGAKSTVYPTVPDVEDERRGVVGAATAAF